jgi:hypothetical protein
MLHKEWFTYYKNQYYKALQDGGLRGVYPTARSVAKFFSVDAKTVTAALKNEGWKEEVEKELLAKDAKSADLKDYLENIEKHRKVGFTANNQIARLAFSQFKSQERIQKILDRRLTVIEQLIDGEVSEEDERIVMHLGEGDLNEYVKVTVGMMATASRAAASVIGALAKTNAIASESLDIQETVLLVQQMELDLDLG